MGLRNLIDTSRLGAFTFFVIIADATWMGLFAFLAQLSSHFSNFLLSKMRPVRCVHPHTMQYSYPCMVRSDHFPVCAIGKHRSEVASARARSSNCHTRMCKRDHS